MDSTLSVFTEHGPVWALVGVLLTALFFLIKFVIKSLTTTLKENTESNLLLRASIEKLISLNNMEKDFKDTLRTEHALLKAQIQPIKD